MKPNRRFLPRPYRRAWWLPGAHLQTFGGWLLRPRDPVALHRERLDMSDGDFVDLDFASAGRWSDTARRVRERRTPLVLILHGLEGGSHALPAQAALREVAVHGMQGVVMNFRSCSGEMNRTARFYHAGDTGDLARVVATLRAWFPGSPLGIQGYSLGGNVLLKFLGERGRDASGDVRAAAAISVPFDLAAGSRQLERGMGRVYSAHFLRSLLRKYRSKAEMIASACDADRVLRSRTIREFDAAGTAPLHGFRDVEHYYESSSSARFLARIRVRTLLLHAVDDPFLPASAVPRDAVDRNPALTAHFPRHGGHMGFIAGGAPWRAEYWAEAEAARFLAHHLRS
jgi:uncharacterized protein